MPKMTTHLEVGCVATPHTLCMHAFVRWPQTSVKRQKNLLALLRAGGLALCLLALQELPLFSPISRADPVLVSCVGMMLQMWVVVDSLAFFHQRSMRFWKAGMVVVICPPPLVGLSTA